MLSVEEAQQQILSNLKTLGSENTDLLSCVGRICAKEVIARRSLPPFDNSAMDGYAVLTQDGDQARPVIATIACGDPVGTTALQPKEAARIMTGAPLPPGADAVIMQEEALLSGDLVSFSKAPSLGQHVRRKGTDVTAGEVLLGLGQKIGASEVAALAAQGFSVLPIFRRPTVAIVSTGSELVEIDEDPGSHKIVNSNAYALAALVKEAGANPVVLGIAKDNLEETQDILSRGLFADVLVTSGGVSVGEFDYVKEALDALGYQAGFWKINMKPGKPVVFGTLQGKPVFGLPGNPVSCQVSFELFVRPLLLSLSGEKAIFRPRFEATLSEAISGGERRHFVRAKLTRQNNEIIAAPLRKQGSGELRSILGANALLDIPPKERLNPKDKVTAIAYQLDFLV